MEERTDREIVWGFLVVPPLIVLAMSSAAISLAWRNPAAFQDEWLGVVYFVVLMLLVATALPAVGWREITQRRLRRLAVTIDSSTVGDTTRFLSFETLVSRLESMTATPTDEGRVTRIMARGRQGVRQLLESTLVTPDEGVPGDAWGRDAQRQLGAQIAVMQEDVANLIANGQPLELSGDNLWLDMDLRSENLPTGTRLRIGPDAEFEVTPEPHNGCRKFRARFGPDALRFVADKSMRQRNLRGIYLRVIHPGTICVGDLVRKL